MFGEEYSSIYPKVKYWENTLLNEEEFTNLLKMNLTDTLLFLRSKVKKISITSDDITEIEHLLKQETYNFIRSGMRFITGSTKEFLNDWLKFYEIENIKMISRALLTQKPILFLYELFGSSKFRREFIKDLKSIDDFQEFLIGTEYYRLALDSFPRVKEEKNNFFFEINLDNYFTLKIVNSYKNLKIYDKEPVRSLLLFFLECNRIISISRAKFLYKMSSEEIVAIIPNLIGIINNEIYEQLVLSEDRESFLNLLKKINFISKTIESNVSIERELYKSLKNKAKKAISSLPFSLNVFLGFIILNIINIRNWIVILESKRLKLSYDQIKSKFL